MDPWSRGREVACDVLRSLPDLENFLIFAIGEGSRFLVVCFLYTSDQLFFSQTPGRRPPRITGLHVNYVTLGWVGAPNERAPLTFHGAVVGFVDRCQSRTRNLAASNKHEFFSGRSWAKICPGITLRGTLKSLKLFFLKICAHSERYKISFGGYL